MQAKEIEVNVVFSSDNGDQLNDLELWEMLVAFAESKGLRFGGSLKALDEDTLDGE